MAASVQNGASDNTASADARSFGLEAIAAYKSFKIQGEYTRGDYRARFMDVANITLDNEAYYGEVLWLVSGENYSSAYKKGTFSSIKPNKNFDLENFSGLGAWELGLRYEAYDVSNGSSAGYSSASAPAGVGHATRFQGSLNCNGTATNSATNNQSGCSSGAHTWTAGIKWVINPNVMLKGAYSRTTYDDAWAHFDLAAGGTMKHEDLLSIRTQFAF
jgi:phosphate-selective porin OprO/OprP